MNNLNKKYILSLLLLCFLSCSQQKEDMSPIVEEELSAEWLFIADNPSTSDWFEATYDDSSWTTLLSTETLADQNIKTKEGYGLLRKKIILSDSLASSIRLKGAAVLNLDKFGSCEEVYINGQLVGKTGEFPPNYTGYTNHEREYLIHQKYLNLDGENIVAIKFNEGWGAGGFLGKKKVNIASASTEQKVQLTIDVASPNYIFFGDDTARFTLKIENENKWGVNASAYITLTTDTHEVIKQDSIEIKINGKEAFEEEIIFPQVQPGFYRIAVELRREENLVATKKLNIGYEPEKIESPRDAKEDFKEFWDRAKTELGSIKPNYRLTHLPQESNSDYDLFLVQMNSYGNEVISGYYAKPKKDGKHPVIIEYMGYGSDAYFPNRSWDGYAYFVLSVRGQGFNKPTNRYGTWITNGLDNRENYYYKGAFLDLIRAIDFVCSRNEVDVDKIGAKGGSQGGAFTFAAAALDDRIKVAGPTIPFLSDYRDYFKITDWPKNDFDSYMKANPDAQWDDVYDLLTYFDIKNLASWIECPLIMGIGVQDEVCPPHINFAAYNEVQSPKEWMAFPEHGHSAGKEYYDAMNKLFDKYLK